MRGRLLAALLLLQGCANTEFAAPPGASDEARYEAAYPYYAEFCALSEIQKIPGQGVDIGSGGPGGHSVLYLNGVCRLTDAGYPVITLCDAPKRDEGVGLSVNAHYKNAIWTATEGRDFFFRGGLAPGQPVNAITYAQAQSRAKTQGILDGVIFHKDALADRPPTMSVRDYMYELSIATDYAVAFGRDRYCARVPLDRPRMARVVNFLNDANAPYRIGAEDFVWNVLENNCGHLTHNALATVGVWRDWPVERPLLESAFDFPVPKNEFVNLMRRINDLPIANPAAIEADDEVRTQLLEKDWLPTRPGGLAEAEPAIRPNSLYRTNLRLIFFDEPIFGHYQQNFDAIFKDPRYTNLAANSAYFTSLYERILTARPAQPTPFERIYYDHIAAELADMTK
jgi:hypothetical protein